MLVADLLVRTSLTLPYVGTDFSVRLYCWQHNTTHALPLADVEKAIYALGWHAINTNWAPGAFENRVERPHPFCLIEVLAWDSYAEWVEQGVGCREAAEVTT